jgi:hypothetical protein
VTTIEINCGVSTIPSGTGVYVAGEFSEQNTIGFAEGIFWRRPLADGDWQLNTTARLPINLRPFMDPSDIKSVVCDTQAKVMRLTRPGVDHVSFQRASDPSSTQFLPGLSTASGTTSVHRVIINVED